MNKLYNKLKKYTLEDAIKIEESDRQYLALKLMGEGYMTHPGIPSLNSNGRRQQLNYLGLIIANAIICYQLSGKGEDYWEEFGDFFLPLIGGGDAGKAEGVIYGLSDFIKQSKNNKRFIDTKIKRLEKLKPFLEKFIGREEEYYDDMEKLRDELAKTMKQKKDAKTIVFAVKMFSYGARNYFDRLVYFPESISIPIDSRLNNLFESYKGNYTDINKFYFDLSNKLKIPELHLDAIVWVNYDELIK